MRVHGGQGLWGPVLPEYVAVLVIGENGRLDFILGAEIKLKSCPLEILASLHRENKILTPSKLCLQMRVPTGRGLWGPILPECDTMLITGIKGGLNLILGAEIKLKKHVPWRYCPLSTKKIKFQLLLCDVEKDGDKFLQKL